jgi:3-methyladenine DNA glycosylase AlkD
MPDLSAILDDLQRAADPLKAPQMKAYMRNQFEFLGVQAPALGEVNRRYLPKSNSAQELDWEFIEACWANPYRELQYVAISYLSRNENLLEDYHIPNIQKLIVNKSWWDTVDSIVHLVGVLVQKHPELKELMVAWSLDGNLWIRRTAIEHQLAMKKKTDTELMEIILTNNFGSKEFFINKAIGWVLREYSKTDPGWVRGFLERHHPEMANLSIREAEKYI